MEKLKGFPNKSALLKKKSSKPTPSIQIESANVGERRCSGAEEQSCCLRLALGGNSYLLPFSVRFSQDSAMWEKTQVYTRI